MVEKSSFPEILKQEDIVDYKNPDLAVDDRVNDLLGRMTLEEKVAQMLCIWKQKSQVLLDENGNFDPENLIFHLPHGIGQMARLSDTAGGLSPRKLAELANAVQKLFLEKTRLGIPVVFHEECLHGLVAKDATSYPQPIGLASTFNPELIEDIYTAIAEDARSRGVHQALTPVLDVARDPRWGRVEETFGEDPYLIAQMGIAAVKGFQGNASFDDNKRVIATLKHFAAHGEPESGTNCAPVNVSERILRDVFLYPFKEVLDKANALCVMASYNEIDGIPSHANQWLLRDVLRKEWGFEGFVVSDYFAITELNERELAASHYVAGNKSDAALLAARASVNLEFPDRACYPNLVELVNTGQLEESVIDELVGSILKQKFRLGLFENPFVDPELIQYDIKLENDRDIALRAARETITLLKNDNGLLPLSTPVGSTIAVIGPNADRVLLGGYSGKPKYYTTVLDGIRRKVGGDANVLYSEGCKITVGGSWDEDLVRLPDPEEEVRSIARAVETAKRADMVVLVLGDNEQTSREAWDKNHMGDRASLELFGKQNELVKAIAATGKPLVAVLFNGRPVSITQIQNDVPAVLECWYLGQETGHAVADVLFGDYNPAGKLPISIPRSVGHIPSYYNHKPSARRGYLQDDISPLFPFGYGLSYTSFKFSNMRLETSTIRLGQSTRMLVDVENCGQRDGQEVVQMYIHDIISTVTRPVKELKGFRKIHLKAGETKTVALTILPEHLAFTNIDKKYTVEPGEFEIMVGNSSRDQDLLKAILRVE